MSPIPLIGGPADGTNWTGAADPAILVQTDAGDRGPRHHRYLLDTPGTHYYYEGVADPAAGPEDSRGGTNGGTNRPDGPGESEESG